VSGNLGATEVAALCTQIDAAYKAGEEPSTEETIRLASAIRELKQTLERAGLGGNTASEIPKPTPEGLKKLFDQIQKDLRGGNMVQIEDQNSFAEGLKESVDPGELRVWRNAMDEFDYDKALKIMGGWKMA
jgi:HPt (histidine-containing phosphotransfer) domain-containing protein